ncbi:MAG: Prophage antirepressor [Parcubacteria group bacterium GW2011_GWA2_40_23]|nr:MAG: Prophage antirepressor [Parcubacteria group bacterium GW2011_GWA2_40_23]
MKNTKKVTIFEGKKVRRIWEEAKELWYFAVVDVIAILTGSSNPQVYWRVLKKRLIDEGSNETVTKCNGLKVEASDGKMRLTDMADTETLFRLIQSIPSPKAEPFKIWLAKVGYERIEELNDPEKALNRSREYWQKMGRSKSWIQQRMMGQEIRNKLTDYWQKSEVQKQNEFAILTNIIHEEWTDLTINEHKKLKSLKKENLRDHMTDAELVFTALAELSTRQIAETMQSVGLEENKVPAKHGGKIAKNARVALESKTKKKVVTGKNFLLSGKDAKRLKK